MEKKVYNGCQNEQQNFVKNSTYSEKQNPYHNLSEIFHSREQFTETMDFCDYNSYRAIVTMKLPSQEESEIYWFKEPKLELNSSNLKSFFEKQINLIVKQIYQHND